MILCRYSIKILRVAALLERPLCYGTMEVDFRLEDGVAGREDLRPRDVEVGAIPARKSLRRVVGVVASLEQAAF